MSPGTPILPLRKSCQSCNMAKLKCTGHRPQCARCMRRGTPCVYPPSKPVGRPPKRSQQCPSSAPALRGLKPIYCNNPSTPPNDTIIEPQVPSPQPDFPAGDQDAESYMAAALLALEDGTQYDLHPATTSLYTASDYSLLYDGRATDSRNEDYQPTTPPLTSGTDTYASSTTADDWYFDDLPDFVLSPTGSVAPCPASQPPLSALQTSLAAYTGTSTDKTAAPSSFHINRSMGGGRGRGRETPCCPCLTTIINLLLHRNKMRKRHTSTTATPMEQPGHGQGPGGEAGLSRQLEALMQQGLSAQQRCNLCLEDPLVAMIWARITDEYLTTAIASRRNK